MIAHFGNAILEVLGSLFVSRSIISLYHDKMVRGVSPWMIGFFTYWGYWNLFYYPSVGDTVSFYACIAVTAANTTYLGMMLYYIKWEGGRHV